MANSDLTALMVSGTVEEHGISSSCDSSYDDLSPCTSKPPEPQEGNIEYKLKLLNPSPSRFEHLVTQMKWRLREGHGEAIYEIGVADNGAIAGLALDDLQASLETLNNMALKIGANTSLLRRCAVDQDDSVSPSASPRYVAEVLVRTMPDDHQVLPLRVAALGGEAAGKSSLLGVLTSGKLDSGEGSARLNLLQHPHELVSGHTSSICHAVLGFDKCGEVVNYEARTAEAFFDQSAKLVSFVDLAGHKKYQRTTVFGLSSSQPEFAMLVVSATGGIENMTREHLGWTMALRLPLFIVITKTDLCAPSVCQNIVRKLTRTLSLPGSKRTVLHVHSKADSIQAATTITDGMVIPIFTVSSLTGDQLDHLKHFLNLLPARLSPEEQAKLEEECAEFQVEETYNVNGIGTVVGGILRKGVVRLGDSLMFGPNQDGTFSPALVMGLRRNRLPCRMIRAGQVATIAVPSIERTDVRHGAVLLSDAGDTQSVCWEFEAQVYMLNDPGAMQVHRQVNVLMGTVRQGVTILKMSDERLVRGKSCTVHFRFLRTPEYVCKGRRLIVQCGSCKGIGDVVSVLPVSADTTPPKPSTVNRRKRLATT